jgi:hypothetical protein
MAALLMVSLFPIAFKWKLHTTGYFHDYVHFAAFLITAIFIWLLADSPIAKTLGFAGGLVFSYGQEWAENWLYHAGFEWRDVTTDLAGLLSGFALMMLITSLSPDRRN